MVNANTGAGPEPGVKSQSGLLRFSLSMNVVLGVMVLGLAVWGWERHQQVVEMDKKLAAANEERDEAYQTSRELQYGLIKARGELKGIDETLRPQSAGEDQGTDTPP
jgi:hypothetical protein